MANSIKKFAIAAFGLLAAGCQSHHWIQHDTVSQTVVARPATPAIAENAKEDIGGNLRESMDKYDREKLSRALDKSPGKMTHWVNKMSGTSYSVVPTGTAHVADNPYCRRYQINAVTGSGANKEMSGVACVEGSTWKSVEG